MEMCYDGALVMPSSYAVMDEEEMMYLEGGGTVTLVMSVEFLRDCITATLSAVVSIACAGIGIAVGGWIGGKIGKSVGSVVGGALGAAIGWIIGGSVARGSIKSSQTVKIEIPIISSRTIYLN